MIITLLTVFFKFLVFTVGNNNRTEFVFVDKSYHQQNMTILYFLSIFPRKSDDISHIHHMCSSTCFFIWISKQKNKKQIEKSSNVYTTPTKVHLRYKKANTNNNGPKFLLTITNNNEKKLRPSLPINLTKITTMKMHRSKL
jgi:hypothetical protein